ncbi:MAG: DUF4864 domain-containing protein, partial [Opitutales bacterium]|nr:DUF4864 domain-containing protein [Opitutales bacterium]
MRSLLTVAAVAVAASCATGSDGLASVRELVPTPDLSPRDVVDIQLRALGNNNVDNEGVEIAFRFASPANRLSTGPLERFAAMMRGGQYNAMLEHDRFVLAPTVVRGERALQRVAVYTQRYVVVYDFYLRRQTAEPYIDCWMVEAVVTRGVVPNESE